METLDLSQIEAITLEKAAEKYPRQWLGAKVVEREKDTGQPLKVKVITRNTDVHVVRTKIGLDDVCIFYTGPIPEIKTVLLF